MTPEQIKQLEERIKKLESILFAITFSDRLILSQHFELLDGRNIKLGTSVGTRIGTATTEKIGFFNTTPAAQQASISDADGTLASATSRINAILDVLDVFGFTA